MKFSKLEIAKLLATTPNVMANESELLQFFRSPQYHPDDENEGNHIEDFHCFRNELDNHLLEYKNWSIENTFLKGRVFEKSKIPVKVQKQLEKERIELETYISQSYEKR